METDRHFCANLNTLVCVCVYEKSSRSRPSNSPIGDDHANMHSALSLICKNLPTPKQQQQNSRRNKKKNALFCWSKELRAKSSPCFCNLSLALTLVLFAMSVAFASPNERETIPHNAKHGVTQKRTTTTKKKEKIKTQSKGILHLK